MSTTIKKMNVYLAGPMRGYKRLNKEAFDRIEASYRKMDWVGEVFNPVTMDENAGVVLDGDREYTQDELKEFIMRDFRAIMQCQGIVMLSGWEKSHGARVEHALAVYLGLAVFYVD